MILGPKADSVIDPPPSSFVLQPRWFVQSLWFIDCQLQFALQGTRADASSNLSIAFTAALAHVPGTTAWTLMTFGMFSVSHRLYMLYLLNLWSHSEREVLRGGARTAKKKPATMSASNV